MYFVFNFRTNFLLFSLCALTACNSESELDVSPGISLVASNVVLSSFPNHSETVDLSVHVSGSTNWAEINSLKQLNGSCKVIEMYGMNAIIESYDGGICEFEYTILDATETGPVTSNTATLLILSTTGPEYPVESVETTVGETKVINLSWLTGELDSLIMIGASTADLTSAQEITIFTEFAGYSNLAYTTNEPDGTVGAGTVRIVTSMQNHQPPSWIPVSEYMYEGETKVINLGENTNAEQVVAAYANDRAIVLLDHNNPKSIVVEVLDNGFDNYKDYIDISLVLSDHRGGFSFETAMIKKPYDPARDSLRVWETDNYFIIGPPNEEQVVADFESFPFDNCGFEDNPSGTPSNPTFTDSKACLNLSGHLPLTMLSQYCDELQSVVPAPRGLKWETSIEKLTYHSDTDSIYNEFASILNTLEMVPSFFKFHTISYGSSPTHSFNTVTRPNELDTVIQWMIKTSILYENTSGEFVHKTPALRFSSGDWIDFDVFTYGTDVDLLKIFPVCFAEKNGI